MDFFTAQDHARRNTGRLVFFFLLAVLSLIVLTNILVMATIGYFRTGSLNPFDWRLFCGIGGAVLLVVAGGTLYKISALSKGGDAVAAMFGAEPLFADDADLDHRKVVHVVEEMAIASGTPVPQVYLLKENGINAFAAGFSTSDAIIAVTKGAIRNLNREQLQGVIAHEFSHILNGDMRLNIRLVGVLHGILLIGLIGYQILRGSGNSGSSRKGSGGAVLLGLGLIIIGYTGTFFGKLIKAAVSRQREFLADAAAVQFTRNPDGIGGALLQIGAGQNGSLLTNPKSEELSHAFFCQGVAVTFESLFATHPPLTERIRRILPAWDGQFPRGPKPEKVVETTPASTSDLAAETAAGLTGSAVMEHIGRPNMAHLMQARQLLREIPDVLQKAARDPFASRALLIYLILDPNEEIRVRQLEQLKSVGDRGVYAETRRLIRMGGSLKREQRLPLIELALPTLRRLSKEQSQLFLENLNALIRTDDKITLFEWCLLKIVVQHLTEVFGQSEGQGQAISGLGQVTGDCMVVISTLVNATRHVGLKAAEVFAAAAKELGQPEMKPAPPEQLGLAALDRSLKVLKRLKPQEKSILLKACAACVVADGQIDPVEAELLRGVAATLSVPMPPLTIDKYGTDSL
jgi:Zn-dependent protease with chaperone function